MNYIEVVFCVPFAVSSLFWFEDLSSNSWLVDGIETTSSEMLLIQVHSINFRQMLQYIGTVLSGLIC